METKEEILKRLLKNNYITIDELFILNDTKEKVIIKNYNETPISSPRTSNGTNPYWYDITSSLITLKKYT